jgi:type II secretory pathway component PulM
MKVMKVTDEFKRLLSTALVFWGGYLLTEVCGDIAIVLGIWRENSILMAGFVMGVLVLLVVDFLFFKLPAYREKRQLEGALNFSMAVNQEMRETIDHLRAQLKAKSRRIEGDEWKDQA